jgi:hypothetical protein
MFVICHSVSRDCSEATHRCSLRSSQLFSRYVQTSGSTQKHRCGCSHIFSLDGLVSLANTHAELINSENMNLTDSRLDSLDGWSALSQGCYLHRTTHTQNKRRQTFVRRVGFEPTIAVFERTRIFRALDRAATDSGAVITSAMKSVNYLWFRFNNKLRFRKAACCSASRYARPLSCPIVCLSRSLLACVCDRHRLVNWTEPMNSCIWSDLEQD